MNKYIVPSAQNAEFSDAKAAIIVLPDIYGQTDYAKNTLEELAKTFRMPTFLLDYFYSLTNTPTNIAPDKMDEAVALMNKLSGEKFVEFFSSALKTIQLANPNIVEIYVVGFCFAGRLAYLTGLESSVQKIVSFYGAGAAREKFYNGQSVVEALAAARKDDTNLHVLAFFGTEDQSIPEPDRAKTQQILQQAGIEYEARQYQAGHAYFQPGRANYSEPAAQSSWQDLKNFLV